MYIYGNSDTLAPVDSKRNAKHRSNATRHTQHATRTAPFHMYSCIVTPYTPATVCEILTPLRL